MSELVQREDQDGLATLTLNRPPELNFHSATMQERIAAFRNKSRVEV